MKMIDAFGQMRIDGGPTVRARLIELTPVQLAAFPENDPATPVLVTLSGPYQVRGRNLTASLIGDGTLEFRRASCGCQTPNSLRGPRSKFVALVGETADA